MMSLQKAEHADVECVVAITSDHVTGARHVEDFEPRNMLAEFGDAGFGHDVALHAAHQQGRLANALRIGQQHLRHQRRLHGLRSVHELRVPVPMQASVAPAQILHQARRVLGARPVGVVGRHGLGGLFERGETVQPPTHEAGDLLGADRIDARYHVDQHQGAGDRRVTTSGGVQ